METISPYAFAAILILIRIFALSMYVPSANENPAITAVCAIAISAVKLLSFIPLFIIRKRKSSFHNQTLTRCGAVFAAVTAAVYLLMINDAFSTVVESVYPDRFTKIGVAAVMLLIAAYVASMGIHGISRSASICTVTFIIILLIIFTEMRSSMLNDRINLYSGNVGKEIIRTSKNILAFLGDYFVFAALLPYLKRSPAKAAGLYIAADILISLSFFLMSASVMGNFYSKTGFSFFTLAYCTHGSMIDRSDGIFLAVSTCCGLICCAAMLLILKDSLNYLFPIKSDPRIYAYSAVILTAANLSLISFGQHIGEHTKILSAISTAIIFAAGIIRLFIRSKKGESAK